MPTLAASATGNALADNSGSVGDGGSVEQHRSVFYDGVMQTTAELAGLFVAHHLWFLVEGAPVTPTLAYELVDGTRQISRIMMPDAQDAVAYGQEWLEENPEHATRAVLVADGFITLGERKLDAVIFQCRCYVEPVGSLVGAVPYRPKDDVAGFAVYPLQFLEGMEGELDTVALGEAFFAGMERHSHASQLWDEHFEEWPHP